MGRVKVEPRPFSSLRQPVHLHMPQGSENTWNILELSPPGIIE